MGVLMYWESDLPYEKIRESFPMWQSACKLGEVLLPDYRPPIPPSGVLRWPLAVPVSFSLPSMIL
jgi:hypothetical protein